MANFIAVPAADMERFLEGLCFERGVQREEVVYTRRSKRNPNVLMKVYTSIRVGHAAVRAAGRDAIRVCVVFDDGHRSFGIGKFPPVMRVHSVKSVLDRTFDRIQEAAQRANQWMTEEERRAPQAQAPQAQAPQNQAQQAWREHLEEKAAYAEYERLQEQEAFEAKMRAEMDDGPEPDYNSETEAERRMDAGRCPDGCCG